MIGQGHVDALKVSLARADQPPVGVLIHQHPAGRHQRQHRSVIDATSRPEQPV
jgi:hypothetical protein